MIRTSGAKGRFVALALFVICLLGFILYRGPYEQLSTIRRGAKQTPSSGAVLTGHAIAPKLGNATAKSVRSHSNFRCAVVPVSLAEF